MSDDDMDLVEELRASADALTEHDDRYALLREAACEVASLRARVAELEALLQMARGAMMEPHGEWHDIKCNKSLVEIREALPPKGGA